MDVLAFAASIKLHPRAVVLHGTVTVRDKLGGSLRGTTPHYLIAGNPTVDYRPDGSVSSLAAAAGIEAVIVERPSPLSVFAGARKVANFSQVAFGSDNMEPTEQQYHVLREAGQILAAAADRSLGVFVVALPVLTPAKFGTTQGVYTICGVFAEADGAPLWVHPTALSTKLLSSAFPESQKHRSLAAVAAAPPAPDAAIAQIHAGLTAAKLTGPALRTALVAALQGTLGAGTEGAVDAFLAGSSKSSAAPKAEPSKAIKAGVMARMKGAPK